MTYTFYFENIDCPNCAAKIERAFNKLVEVKEVNIDFMTTVVRVETTQEIEEEVLLHKLNEVSNHLEEGSIIKKEKGKVINPSIHRHEHNHEEICDSHGDCGHHHDHIHEHSHAHDHGHSHEHGEKKYVVPRILISLVLFGISFLITNETIQMFILVTTYLIIGYDILFQAFRNIMKGQIFDENFLMSLASVGAVLIGEYPEAVAVILFYQVGEYFQDKAVGQSRASIAELMDIRPDYANLLVDHVEKRVDPETIAIGDIILVKVGEKVPLDGVIVTGTSSLDVSALTGESRLRDVQEEDEVMSGSINKSGILTIEVTKTFDQSTVSKILELVENASSNKSQSEKFITKFARYYTPIVVAIAAVIAFVVPFILTGSFSYDYIHRALVFLVISCPCALVISVPLSFYGGIGGASKAGILFKGSNYIEALSSIDTVVFDKTGTLTKGNFVVSETISDWENERILELAAYAEYYSTHPIGHSIVSAYQGEIDTKKLKNVQELEHLGMKVNYGKDMILAGNQSLMDKEGVEIPKIDIPLSKVYIAKNNEYIGTLIISDEIKPDAKQAISELSALGITNLVMLTGDTKEIGEKVASELGLSKVYTEMYPKDKVDIVERFLQAKQQVAFMGDGINDAPVLTLADVGIAMGGVGSDAAIEAADVIIMDDQPSKLAKAIRIARKTMGIAKQNIIFALGIKVVVLVLGALGIANMWMAVFADVGVSVLAILNAMRGLKV